MTTTADQTIFGSYGEFASHDLPQTDEEWASYDSYLADEMANFDAMREEEDFYLDLDPDNVPF